MCSMTDISGEEGSLIYSTEAEGILAEFKMGIIPENHLKPSKMNTNNKLKSYLHFIGSL